MVYLFCAYRKWALDLYKKLSETHKKNIILLKSPKKLTYRQVRKINPELIFFPDWSWIVPKQIVEDFKCVCFHESNLPKFRGGSPLQNQIIRDIKKTKSTAFFMTHKLDDGDIILQKDLSLEGTLSDVFERMKKNDYEMINKIIKGEFKIRKQKGKQTIFKRRKPEQSELKNLDHSKKYLHNFIRMLEIPYPNAFIKIGNRKIVFKSAMLKNNELSFEGEIV